MKLPFIAKKKSEEGGKGRGYVPIDRVKELMGRGFSEIDTIDVLRREGFSPDEIDKALERTIKEGVVSPNTISRPSPTPGGVSMQPGEAAPPPSAGFQSLGQAFEQSQQGPAPTFPPKQQSTKQQTPTPAPTAPQAPRMELPTMEELSKMGGKSPVEQLAVPETSLPDEYYQGYPTEEYIDYVVQEHMHDVNDKLKEFSIRYKELESRIGEMNERLKVASTTRSGEQQKILSKIDSFNETINEVNMRIAGLEKAFKDTLPALIESVRSLSDLVQRLKREA